MHNKVMQQKDVDLRLSQSTPTILYVKKGHKLT